MTTGGLVSVHQRTHTPTGHVVDAESDFPALRGGKDRYFQAGETQVTKLVAEGIEGRVPYKGPVGAVVFQLVGGVRSGMGYCGVRTIEELRTKTNFVRITDAGAP